MKQKPGGGGGGGVEARDFIVSEGHEHPLVIFNLQTFKHFRMSFPKP